MKYLPFAVLMLLLMGCQAKAPFQSTLARAVKAVKAATPTPTPEWTDAHKIAALRAEAHKRGLRWSVTCMDWDEDDPSNQFFAMAQLKSEPPDVTYIEDGAQPWWAENGPTQAEAAYRLYLSIQQPPNLHPDHRPEAEHHHKKICPPELRGN